MKKARNIVSELLIFVWCYFTTSKSSFFPYKLWISFFSIFIFKKQLIFFLTQDRRFFFSAGTSQYLVDISKESKMREHLTKKGAVNFSFDRVNF